jgi:hypothetical protein
VTEQTHETTTKIESDPEHRAPAFLKKAILANIIILGSVLISVVLIIRHLNPTQAVNALRGDIYQLEKRLALAEEKINLYETHFLTLDKKLETFSSQKSGSTKQEVDASYQKLIRDFKFLMDTKSSLHLSFPFLEKIRLFDWFARYIQIKELPHPQAYRQAYELLKQGNLLQAIELLRPLAQDSSSPLSHWLKKATTFYKSLSTEE